MSWELALVGAGAALDIGGQYAARRAQGQALEDQARIEQAQIETDEALSRVDTANRELSRTRELRRAIGYNIARSGGSDPTLGSVAAVNRGIERDAALDLDNIRLMGNARSMQFQNRLSDLEVTRDAADELNRFPWLAAAGTAAGRFGNYRLLTGGLD